MFVDPQVLLDKVSELVQFVFELQNPIIKTDSDSKTNSDSEILPLPLGWQQFDKFAQVTEKFLENDRFSSHYHEPVFTRKHLTVLLEKLLVFARLSPDTWFMPCVLKHLKAEEIQPHCKSRSPLVVHFPDGGPQHRVCCSLIAHVLLGANQYPSSWDILQKDKAPACLHRNCVQFQVSGYGGYVMLIDRFTFFEVHVHTSKRKLVELWGHVRSAVFKGLSAVSLRLGYFDNKPGPAILCPCGQTEKAHPAYIRDGEWICSSTNDFGDVSKLEGIPEWLEKSEYKEGEVVFHHVQ